MVRCYSFLIHIALCNIRQYTVDGRSVGPDMSYDRWVFTSGALSVRKAGRWIELPVLPFVQLEIQ